MQKFLKRLLHFLANITDISRQKIENIKVIIRETLAYALAFLLSLAPIDWATNNWAPFLGIISSANDKTIKNVAAAADETAKSPKYWLINFMSVKLYKIETNDVKITGKDSLNKFRPILPVSMSTFFRIKYSPRKKGTSTTYSLLTIYFLIPNFSIRLLYSSSFLLLI